jgi:hypothetical protein
MLDLIVSQGERAEDPLIRRWFQKLRQGDRASSETCSQENVVTEDRK